MSWYYHMLTRSEAFPQLNRFTRHRRSAKDWRRARPRKLRR